MLQPVRAARSWRLVDSWRRLRKYMALGREIGEEFVDERVEFIKLLETRSWRNEPIYHYAQAEYAIYDQYCLPGPIHWGNRSATRCMAAEPVSKARARRGRRRASGRRPTATTRRAGRRPLAAIPQRTWRCGKSTPTNGPASVQESVGVQVGHERPDHGQRCCPYG